MIAAVVALVLILNPGGPDLSTEEGLKQWLETGTYMEGVTIEGIDVSGMTMAQAREPVEEKAQQLVADTKATYIALENTYVLDSTHMGLTADTEGVLEEALLYAKVGTAEEIREQEQKVRTEGVDFLIPLEVNEETLMATLEEQSQEYNIEPVDATVEVVKEEDEDRLYTSGSIQFKEEVPGKGADLDQLLSEVADTVANRTTTTPISVEMTELEPEITVKELKENLVLRDDYETEYPDSIRGRKFNIWKMSTVVNGIVLQPGEVWSINEAAGDRTTENGWADAAGIKNGAYVDEPGGGICQVSSTLYIALIKSEVEIVDRTHHSWPLSYVPVGLDATISSGAPDFKFKNNFDTPIVILVKCDGTGNSTIKVEVYGPPMEYEVRFESETVVNEEPKEPPVTVLDNPSIAPGKWAWTKYRKNRVVAEITKVYYDLETGEEIRREPYSTETYGARVGEISYGPTLSPTPSPSPSAEPSVEPSQEPTPPTASPDVTEKPSETVTSPDQNPGEDE